MEGQNVTTNRVSVTRTQRDRDGNAGMTEVHGFYGTVEEAKGHAETLGYLHHPDGQFHWRQFSLTTWGLMNGQVYTFILVSRR